LASSASPRITTTTTTTVVPGHFFGHGNNAFTHNQHFLWGEKSKKEKGEAKVVW
jgi:hypothetical protein